MLEVSDGGRAVLTGVAEGVEFPLDFSRSFSAFSNSISFCVSEIKCIRDYLTTLYSLRRVCNRWVIGGV